MSKVAHKGAEEARNQLPNLLEGAASGRATIITRRGRPIAALVPLADYAGACRQKSLLAIEGSGRGLWDRDSRETFKQLRDEWSR